MHAEACCSRRPGRFLPQAMHCSHNEAFGCCPQDLALLADSTITHCRSMKMLSSVLKTAEKCCEACLKITCRNDKQIKGGYATANSAHEKQCTSGPICLMQSQQWPIPLPVLLRKPRIQSTQTVKPLALPTCPARHAKQPNSLAKRSEKLPRLTRRHNQLAHTQQLTPRQTTSLIKITTSVAANEI